MNLLLVSPPLHTILIDTNAIIEFDASTMNGIITTTIIIIII